MIKIVTLKILLIALFKETYWSIDLYHFQSQLTEAPRSGVLAWHAFTVSIW